MVTAEGYQSLVTQLYFSGDSHIVKDTWASSPKAKKRILEVRNLNDGTKKVSFDINMATKLGVEPASIGRLTGVYTDENDKSKTLEFFKQGNSLWLKNEVFGVDLEYIDNNKFQPRGTPEQGLTYIFEILASGPVKLTYPTRNNGKIDYSVAMKG